jgi:hypothetical protein
MTSRRIAAVLLTALALAFSGLTVASAPATSAAPKTYYFTMTGTGQAHPEQIFLTADAGPYLTKLEWKGWGNARAVARGVYRSTCASCSPPKRRTATVRFSKLISCGGDVQAYSKGVVTVSKPDRGHHKRVFRIHMGCAPE